MPPKMSCTCHAQICTIKCNVLWKRNAREARAEFSRCAWRKCVKQYKARQTIYFLCFKKHSFFFYLVGEQIIYLHQSQKQTIFFKNLLNPPPVIKWCVPNIDVIHFLQKRVYYYYLKSKIY